MQQEPLPHWIYGRAIRRFVKLSSAERMDEDAGSAQLILTSPPDLSETSLKTWPALFSLYSKVFAKCVACLSEGGVFVVIISDRKCNATVIRKHCKVGDILESLGLDLFAYKIVLRHTKIDLYRFSFSHVLCFRFKTAKRARDDMGPARAGGDLKKDVLGPYPALCGWPRQRSSFAPQLVKVLIESFSKPGQMVVDPFCGTGITQRVALGLGRRAVGYEINETLSSHWGIYRGLGLSELPRSRGASVPDK